MGSELVGGPVGMCYDEDGNFYVGNFDNRKITQILPDGSQVPITQGPTIGWLGFIDCTGGYIYGTLFTTHKIFRYKLDGTEDPKVILGSIAGNSDGGPGEARFNGPNGIIASPNGDTLYVSDFNSTNIRMITNLDGTPSSDREVLLYHSFMVAPNPLQHEALISFELTETTTASIELVNAEGIIVQFILEDKKLMAGKHQFNIKAEGLPSGIYHILLKTDQQKIFSQQIVRMN